MIELNKQKIMLSAARDSIDPQHSTLVTVGASTVQDLISSVAADDIEIMVIGPEDDKVEIISVRGKPMIVHQDHAPEWLVDNKFILHGYRVDFNRKRDLLKSLFMKHNELLNIWTHLIGGVIFIGLIFYMIFYFDFISMIINKIGNLFSKENMEVIKNYVPEALKKIE